MSIQHKSSAKASLRSIFSAYGVSGFLGLVSEVLMENLPARRGRPTRDEKVNRLVLSTLEPLLSKVAMAEGVAMAARMKSDE
jgi:hypothetical protein